MRLGIVVLAGLAQAAAPQRPITTPRELLAAMRARYDGKWYRTLTFTQYNTERHPDGTEAHTVWHEWVGTPGKLRIEFEPADSGNGVLFANDSLYSFHADSQAPARPFVHPLLVLGFDVYAQPVDRTAEQLVGRGFDLSVLSEATWEDRPVWVVGARGGAGDLRTRQFWVDKERLLFVRLLEPSRDTTKTSETRFNKYVPMAGGWVSAEVEFLVDGQRRFLEEYRDIRANVPIAGARWDPRQWKAARRLTP
jgi:hypothetical protein